MAQIGTIQICGNINSAPTEVELNNLAARVVPKAGGLRGSYRCGATLGSLQGNAANYAGLVCNAGVVAIVKKVEVTLGTATITTQGIEGFQLFKANYVGQNAASGSYKTPSKLNSLFPDAICMPGITSGFSLPSASVVDTSALITSVGSSFSKAILGGAAGAGSTLAASATILDVSAGDEPIILDSQFMVCVQAFVATASMTGNISVLWHWDEYYAGGQVY